MPNFRLYNHSGLSEKRLQESQISHFDHFLESFNNFLPDEAFGRFAKFHILLFPAEGKELPRAPSDAKELAKRKILSGVSRKKKI